MNKKQSLFAATAALMFAGSSALAADLPTKAPFYKAPLGYFSWSGCYIGGNVGAAWARGSFTSTFDSGTHLSLPTNLGRVDAAGTGSDRATSFIGGGANGVQ